jgi:Ulp1 family protease
MNTYFYPKIQAQKTVDFDSILKGLSKKGINDLKAFTKILIPINAKIDNGNVFHWYLIVLDLA